MSESKSISWWDKPIQVPVMFIYAGMIICVFGILGSWFFLVTSWNDIPTDVTIMFDINGYKEHLKSLRNELNNIDCDVLAKNLLSDVYSKEHGILYSDYDFAEKEYGYKCLGKERPPPVNNYEHQFISQRGKT